MPRTPDSPKPDDVEAVMEPCEPCFAGEIAEEFDASRRTLTRRLNELADSGRVRKKKHGDRRAVYWIEP